MRSRNVRFSCYRYFKLMYIVAGILMSNENICETVDQLQIAPRVQMKEKVTQQPANRVQHPNVSEQKSALSKFKVFQVLNRLKGRIRPKFSAFSLWTIPNYFIERSTNLLYRTFVINSDCDVIYT